MCPGAERLVLDAALALVAKGHRVVIYTAHYSRQHCFDDSLALDIRLSSSLPPPTWISYRVWQGVRGLDTPEPSRAVRGRVRIHSDGAASAVVRSG